MTPQDLIPGLAYSRHSINDCSMVGHLYPEGEMKASPVMVYKIKSGVGLG